MTTLCKIILWILHVIVIWSVCFTNTNHWIYITILWYSIYDYIILWPPNVNCKSIPQSLYIIKLWSLYSWSNCKMITQTFILIALLSGSGCFWMGLPFHLFKTKTKLNYDLGLYCNHNLYIDTMATLYIFVLSSIYFKFTMIW